MSDAGHFTIDVEQIDGFEFRVRFDKEAFPALSLDEPPPLGHDKAPNASRILAAAVGNCLAASLIFSLKRQGIIAKGISARVETDLIRNDQKRLRIGKLNVTISAPLGLEHSEAIQQSLSTFEDFCVVTQSVRQGIDVQVKVDVS